VGGRAGEGVKKAAQVIAEAFCANDYHACQADDYQSLIKGGHNYSIVTASRDQVYCVHQRVDLMICFDQRSVDEHVESLSEGGLLFFNSDEAISPLGIAVPMNTISKRHYGDKSNVSMAAIAIFTAVTDISKANLIEIIRKQYKRNVPENISYAIDVYDIIHANSGIRLEFNITSSYHYVSGNQAIINGAWRAGLDIYYGYPMTPASSLLHYAALKQQSLAIQAIHAESELAAINMALGSVLAGCRVAVGSSGGGFALMQEAFSAAGMVEAPLLCILSSRPGPATGVSTYTAQEDLFFALNQGHGEFSRIVASPDSIQRALSLAAELLALAWQFQIPTILLTEKQLSEGMTNLPPYPEDLPSADPETAESGSEYKRYQITPSGVSPLLFPGSENSPNTVIKWSTHEHLESGLRTDKAREICIMKEKRAKKAEFIGKACGQFEMVAVYGAGENVVFAYGSTVLELREALKYSQTPFKIVAPIYLEPFPLEQLAGYRDSRAVVVEHGLANQFTEYLKWKLGLDVVKTISKYDGRPFDPSELCLLIWEAFNA